MNPTMRFLICGSIFLSCLLVLFKYTTVQAKLALHFFLCKRRTIFPKRGFGIPAVFVILHKRQDRIPHEVIDTPAHLLAQSSQMRFTIRSKVDFHRVLPNYFIYFFQSSIIRRKSRNK